MQRRVWLIIGLILVGMFILTGPLGAVGFIYEDLGNLGYPEFSGNEAFGINDAGQVVGDAYTSYGTWPFVKSPGQAMQALPCNDPPGNWPGEAVAINGSGTIVGWVGYSGERNACQWVKPFLSYVKEPLGFLGGIASGALAINKSGQIVGWSWTDYGDTRGFVKSQGDVMKALNPLEGHNWSMATGINTTGTICGLSSKTGEQKPCVWIFVLGG
jgi:probable HAF family extracellular repeat protein